MVFHRQTREEVFVPDVFPINIGFYRPFIIGGLPCDIPSGLDHPLESYQCLSPSGYAPVSLCLKILLNQYQI